MSLLVTHFGLSFFVSKHFDVVLARRVENGSIHFIVKDQPAVLRLLELSLKSEARVNVGKFKVSILKGKNSDGEIAQCHSTNIGKVITSRDTLH